MATLDITPDDIQDILNLNFRSKYDYIKSLQDSCQLTDEECNTFLWILDMWDKKQLVKFPTDFRL